jgi:hypothetical protein
VLYMYLYLLSGRTLSPADTDTGLSVVDKSTAGAFATPSRFQGTTTAQKYISVSGAIDAPMATTST